MECENKEKLRYCSYCKDPVLEEEGYILVDGKYYHYDTTNKLKNCYYPELNDEE